MASREQRIGRYEIVAPLAAGGMGQVFLARMRGIGGFERHVVLKTIDLSGDDREQMTAMFLDEARVLGRLHHQHIAPVFEVNEDDGKLYLVIDYIHGRTAQEIWQRALDTGSALPIDFGLAIVAGAASGLHYAHTRVDDQQQPLSIVHRDVSLSNLMIGYDGAIKLIDFGIAKAANRRIKTETGFVKGKLGYLSPEQLRAQEVDARSDVFALGIVLYELTTMARPFREQSDRMTAERIKSGAYRKPSELISNYPRELEAIVQRALRVDPRERYESADAMRRAIEALGHHYELVLGDAAIVEVMTQMFEDRREPWQRKARAETDLEIPTLPSLDDTPPPRLYKKPIRSATEAVEALSTELEQQPSIPPISVRIDSIPTPRPNDVPMGEFDEAMPTAIAAPSAELFRSTALPVRSTTIPVDDEAITAEGVATPLDPPSPDERVASIHRLFTQSAFNPAETPAIPIAALTDDLLRAETGVSVEPLRLETGPVEPPIRKSTKRGIVAGNTDEVAMLSPATVAPPIPEPAKRGSGARIAVIALVLIVLGAIGIIVYTVVADEEDATPDSMTVVPAPDKDAAATATDAAATAIDVATTTTTDAAVATTNDAPTATPSDATVTDAATPNDAASAANSTDAAASSPATDAAVTAKDAATSGPELRSITLKLTSVPTGATVVLDGKRLGKTPFDGPVEVTPGRHVIKLRLTGYNTVKIDVSDDLEREVAMTKAKPKPKPAEPEVPGGLDIPD
jgi:serine/threonine protein kinase/cytoskeletal protein RodZ